MSTKKKVSKKQRTKTALNKATKKKASKKKTAKKKTAKIGAPREGTIAAKVIAVIQAERKKNKDAAPKDIIAAIQKNLKVTEKRAGECYYGGIARMRAM